jgi:hypothetical protein
VVGPESSSATNVVEIRPCIEITKTVDCNDDGEYLSQDSGSYGDTPSWKIDVHNCGDSPLHSVNVTDTNGMSWGPFDLAIGETWSVNYTGVAIYETTTNNATVVGLDELGGVVGPEYSSATNVVTECTGCLKICKYEDKDWDGKKDSCESYLPGWAFNVTGPEGYFWSGTTGGDLGTCCSGCDYCVTLCDLIPGDYTVTEVTPLPEGWTNTDPGGTAPYTKTVTVECDKTKTVKFGNHGPCTGCIKIYKYEDRDGDGRKDWWERVLANWEFTITDIAGNAWSGTTNRYGYVTICNLPEGVYTITETPQAGWTNTDPGGDPPYMKTVTVCCGRTATVKFGNQRECH